MLIIIIIFSPPLLNRETWQQRGKISFFLSSWVLCECSAARCLLSYQTIFEYLLSCPVKSCILFRWKGKLVRESVYKRNVKLSAIRKRNIKTVFAEHNLQSAHKDVVDETHRIEKDSAADKDT